MAKETWTTNDLQSISRFLTEFEETVQQLEQDYEIKVTNLLVTVKARAPINGPQWGIVSMLNSADTTLQFEQGDFEIGPQ